MDWQVMGFVIYADPLIMSQTVEVLTRGDGTTVWLASNRTAVSPTATPH
jgi:hypothetical protein